MNKIFKIDLKYEEQCKGPFEFSISSTDSKISKIKNIVHEIKDSKLILKASEEGNEMFYIIGKYITS